MKQKVHINLWLESETESVTLGVGRVQLLTLVGELGSLTKAAEQLGMSYRAAWGKIKRAEKALNIPLVAGIGSKRDGSKLTPEAIEMIKKFNYVYEKSMEFAQKLAEETGLSQ